jgi:RNase P subunit RPR2
MFNSELILICNHCGKKRRVPAAYGPSTLAKWKCQMCGSAERPTVKRDS